MKDNWKWIVAFVIQIIVVIFTAGVIYTNIVRDIEDLQKELAETKSIMKDIKELVQ